MALTINQWLRSKVDFEVPDITVISILEDNGIEDGAIASFVPLRNKDLALADLYFWIAGSSSSSSGEYESDGGWQHQKSAKTVVNRAYFKALADELRKKWGVATTSAGKIKMQPIY